MSSLNTLYRSIATFLTPVHRLPDEVLVIICEYLVSAKRDVFTDLYEEGSAPWERTFDCQRWRNLAISVPRLWAHIRVVLIVFDPSMRHRYKRWTTQMERSNSHPLFLYACFSIGESVADFLFVGEMIRACRQALSSIHRCSRLILVGPFPAD
ncbi:hypothetical protein BDV98DRAFT_435592 [Pterulicium gracile]|uniref:F-box domain-containing protein n=1 Tax=Pterulicium gracile TaxID=1884261 RepID=A0A5C3QP75_9AGAR|nr:hypothetical protein BDV98DRAFT_435592 [Pterula gracilis]